MQLISKLQAESLPKLQAEKQSLEQAKLEYDKIKTEVDAERQSLDNEHSLQKENLAKLQAERNPLKRHRLTMMIC